MEKKSYLNNTSLEDLTLIKTISKISTITIPKHLINFQKMTKIKKKKKKKNQNKTNLSQKKQKKK